MIFGYLILIIAVVISAIAAYYSVVGLAAIFAAAVIPVMIMGGALEAGKIVATVWLHNNWQRAGAWFKLYLIPAIVFLMLLTSMGIFGFLSKAHGDQSLVSGDAIARVAIYDEKIRIAKDNIDANRKALKQMDEAVDQVMGRSSDEKGADKAVQIRRSQQKERARLVSEIAAEQKTVTALSEESAPLRAEFRKVEAEVGPIKYIAALIYGDNPDQNLLEAAVRWVIILIVIVFDPLALTLILAGNKQLQWARAGKGGWVHEDEPEEEHVPPANNQGFSFFEFEKKPEETPPEPEPVQEAVVEPPPLETTPAEAPKEVCYKCGTTLENAPGIGPFCPNKDCDVVDNTSGSAVEFKIDPETQAWFDAGRLRARELDREAEAQRIEQGNELLAEVIEPREPEIDIIAADAEHIAALEAQQIETQAALDTLVEKFDELAAEKDSLVEDKQVLQTRLDQKQLDLVQAQTENATLAQAVVEIESQLTSAEQEAVRLRERIAELERSQDPETVTVEPEQEPELPPEDTPPLERPGDYITPPDDINNVYNDERLVSKFDKRDMPERPIRGMVRRIPEEMRRGIQSNFELMKANRSAGPVPSAEDDIPESGKAGFGIRFPETAGKGDMFLRVDMMPNRAYKYNGIKWIEVDKDKTDRFAYDEAYIRHLHQGLVSGEYDLDDLNDTERAQVEQFRSTL